MVETCCWSSFNSFPISSFAALGQVSSSACFSSSRPSTCFLKLAKRRTQSSSLFNKDSRTSLNIQEALTYWTLLQDEQSSSFEGNREVKRDVDRSAPPR